MQFDPADLDTFLDAFDAQTYPVTLAGNQVGTIRGIHKQKAEFSSGHSDQLHVLPSLQCKTADIDNFDQSHRIVIGGADYKIWREPVPKNSGFSIVGLVKA